MSKVFLRQFDQLRNRDIAEFVRDLPCIQKQPDVRRGYAGRHLSRTVLNIVRHQPVVFFAGELGKVSPDMQGGLCEESDTSLCAISGSDSSGLPLSQSAKRLLHAHSPRIGAAAGKECGRASQISRPNPMARKGIQSIYRSTGVRCFPKFRFGGRLPLEQALSRNHVAHERAHHRVQRQQRLVGQKSQRQQDRKVGGQEAAESFTGNSGVSCHRRANQSDGKFDPRWNKQNADRGEGPQKRMVHHQPAEQKQ